MWEVKGKGDVANVACMKNCATEVRLASAIPEYAKGSHGDLAQQMRITGYPKAEGNKPRDPAKSMACLACHGVDKQMIGPAFKEIAARYKGQDGAAARLAEKVRRGGSGAWGSLPMPPNPDLPEAD